MKEKNKMIVAVDQIIEPLIKSNGPGAAVAVIKDGVVEHSRGYGLANLEWEIRITPDTVFRLASITKQFTAVAIMMLQNQGLLSINDPITRFFPDYATSGHDIYVHHLLTHTSGIRSYTAMDGFFENISRKKLSTWEVHALYCNAPFDFKPGTRFSYSNSGYHLLGMIIETVTGKSYGQFIEQAIFKPLGMAHSYYLDNDRIVPKRAGGYVSDELGFQNAPFLDMSNPLSAGGLGSTLEDMILWDRSLDENRLIDAETLKQMHTPRTLNDSTPLQYGFGWFLDEYRGHRCVRHGGNINGFGTSMIRFTADRLTVIVLSNLAGVGASKIMRDVSPHMLGLPPIDRVPMQLEPSVLSQFIGSFVDDEGNPAEISLTGGGLIVDRFGRRVKLVPISETCFYDAENLEFEYQFDDFRNGTYHGLVLKFPLQVPDRIILSRKLT